MTNSDRQFTEHIKQETGRDIEKDNIRCDMCDGHGFSMWEPACEACNAEGVTDEWVYVDCRCRVETEEAPSDCEACFPELMELELAA